MAIVITEADRKKAFDLFDQGEAVGRVALLLFGGHWYKAKKLHDEHRKLQPAAVEATPEQERDAICDGIGKIDIDADIAQIDIDAHIAALPLDVRAKAGDQASDHVEEQSEPSLSELEPIDDPAVWDITVQLSPACMDRIIANFTSQEKADAIAMVLTARLSTEA